jgi:antitoxin component of RelBE/YafQ-DinJ toxin-antitoxin module
MQTKLTLRIDETLVEKAKAWAKKRHISVSQAVAEFFAQLPENGGPGKLSPWTRRLIGVAAKEERAPTDEEIQKDYLNHVQRKHQ